MDIKSRAIGALAANCYIIEAPGGVIAIDPGDDTAAIAEFVVKSPDAIILTHGHFDHTLGAAALKARSGAKIYIGAEDAPMLKDAGLCLAQDFGAGAFTPVEADVLLEAGSIEICGMRFEVIKTPGHTKGGISLYCAEEGFIFTGDTLFERGYGRTDFAGGSMMELVASLRRLFALPDNIRVFPGHGDSALLGTIKKGYGF